MSSFLGKERVSAFLRAHRLQLVRGIVSLGVFASLTVAGHHYVEAHMQEYYRVFLGDQEMGTVADPQVVEQYIIDKYQKLEQQEPDVHHVIDSKELSYKPERAFKAAVDEDGTLQRLDQSIPVKTIGVELVVDGNVIGVVKDQETAQHILDQIKQPYVTAPKASDGVSILSADPKPEPEPGTTEIVSDGFVQDVSLVTKEIQPNDVMKPEDLIKKLVTGDVKPTKYTVQPGDCVSCIAKKFGISRQMIYQNNPWIQDDRIKVGQEMDLTVLQPTLAVKTVERITENQEIQYETEYRTDDSLRQGVTQTISPGKNGLKTVTFLVTKVNGQAMDEELVDEKVIQEPVKEIAKKGTKVVKGEGTGKFAWPVASPRITSSYGTRWGVMHKGIDIVGNKNIMAADNGIVTFVGNKNDGYGNKVIINHQNGYETVYAHLSKFFTSQGKVVEKGEKIGYMGETGDATGVHLHFEIHRNGSIDNPIKYLSR